MGGAGGVLGAGAGGEAACCPASGAGLRAGAGAGVGAGAGAGAADGAAASCAAGGEGGDGAEGAAFCTVGAGVGATAVGPVKTGGRTLVWSIQKAAAIATRTTPASKAHNQRRIASPSRRSEPSPSRLEVDQAMLVDMSHMN